jgi:DNA-binding NarL/FixJ family response regulator
METFNVVIADDHPIVVLGVRELVERDQRFRVVGEAVSSDELIKLLEDQACGSVDHRFQACPPIRLTETV